MKKTVIILSVLALIASSCGQTTKKQTVTESNETVNEQNEVTINSGNWYVVCKPARVRWRMT